MTLFDTEPAPNLTDRQQYALDRITEVGDDGLTSDEIGAHLCHRARHHGEDQRCRYCRSNGYQLACRLRDLGLIRYRAKTKTWTAVTAHDPTPVGMLPTDDEIPF